LTGSTSLIEGGEIDHVQQQAGALQVLEKAMAEPGAFGGTLDQAGNVGDDEAAGFHLRAPRRGWDAAW
jgi:hypothetical protein